MFAPPLPVGAATTSGESGRRGATCLPNPHLSGLVPRSGAGGCWRGISVAGEPCTRKNRQLLRSTVYLCQVRDPFGRSVVRSNSWPIGVALYPLSARTLRVGEM